MSRGWRCVYPSSRLFAIPITHPSRAKFVGHLSKYLCYSLQEAQLSQWDRATLRVIVGRVYCMSLLIFYWNCISYHFWDIQRQRMEWPWNRGSGSFKVIENGAVRWIIYDFLLVVLCCTIFDLFDVEWYHDLEISVRGHSVIQTGTIRKFGCGFLFAFRSNCGAILHHLWDKARYWLKIVIFPYPLAFDAPVRGGVSVGIVPPRLVRKN